MTENQRQRLGIFRVLVARRIRVGYREGKITEADYDKAMQALRSDEVVARTMEETGAAAILNWNVISQWIKDNWLEILKVVLTIAILVLDNRHNSVYNKPEEENGD